MKAILLALVRVYQYLFRPLLGSNCRFAPSCSDYAREAIAKAWRRCAARCSRCAESGAATRIIRVVMTRYLRRPTGPTSPQQTASLTRQRGRLPAGSSWTRNASSCSSSSRFPHSSCGRRWQTPSTAAASASVTTSARQTTPADLPSAPVAATPGVAPVARPGAAPAGAPVAKSARSSVTTDLYRADIDTAGGVITQVALNAHHDFADETKPYLALQRTPERIFVAESGLLGEGMPNHRTTYTKRYPGRASSPPARTCSN